MREIGRVTNELDASVFRDYLFNLGIEVDLEESAYGWTIWVHDENRLAEAASLFARFRENPSDTFFITGAEGAEKKRAAKERADREFAKKVRTREDLAPSYGLASMGKISLALIAISVIVTLLIQFGKNESLVQKLGIAETLTVPDRGTVYYVHLSEVRAGQVWRLVTPIFMHFSILHIIFNMMWLRDLGGMMERISGPRKFALFILAVSILPNIGQFYVSGPGFGGMSGVVYGLLGFVWMQSRYHPSSGYVLHPVTVQMMLIWFVVCLFGLVGNVANTVHGLGLAIGVAWGYLDRPR
jgi:GlpG protein